MIVEVDSCLGSSAVWERGTEGEAALDFHTAGIPSRKQLPGLYFQGPISHLGGDGFTVTGQTVPKATDPQPMQGCQVFDTSSSRKMAYSSSGGRPWSGRKSGVTRIGFGSTPVVDIPVQTGLCHALQWRMIRGSHTRLPIDGIKCARRESYSFSEGWWDHEHRVQSAPWMIGGAASNCWYCRILTLRIGLRGGWRDRRATPMTCCRRQSCGRFVDSTPSEGPMRKRGYSL